jgi:hypothetical protein
MYWGKPDFDLKRITVPDVTQTLTGTTRSFLPDPEDWFAVPAVKGLSIVVSPCPREAWRLFNRQDVSHFQR